MAFRQILDSDVDRLTAMAIQGVNAFITLYEDERESAVGVAPAKRRAPAKRGSPAKRRRQRS